MAEAVNHPDHYLGERKYEPIEVIEAGDLDFSIGNALKYLSRAGRKSDEVEDVKKALWYINRAIVYAGNTVVYAKPYNKHYIDGVLTDWKQSDKIRKSTRYILEGNLDAASVALEWYLSEVNFKMEK
jgi:hypothetical protein